MRKRKWEQAYLHTVLGSKALDVEVGRSLVFKRLIYYPVILLSISSIQDVWRRTYLGELTSPSRPLPLEVGIVLVIVVYVLEPIRQLVWRRARGAYMT
jgi:hypothetical protein